MITVRKSKVDNAKELIKLNDIFKERLKKEKNMASVIKSSTDIIPKLLKILENDKIDNNYTLSDKRNTYLVAKSLIDEDYHKIIGYLIVEDK